MAIVKFSCADIKYDELFKRSIILMRILGQNIAKGDRNFISEK